MSISASHSVADKTIVPSVSPRVEVLDGIRGLAVLMVFLSHSSREGFCLIPGFHFEGIGRLGVYIFFVLSAFLLGGGLFRKGLHSLALKEYAMKRLLRIIPLYYLVVTGVFAVQSIFHVIAPDYLRVNGGGVGLFQHFIFYRGDGVFWTIVIEAQFYLLAPLMAYVLLRFGTRAVFAFAMLSLAYFVLHFSKLAGWSDIMAWISFTHLNEGNYLDVFLPGMLGAYAMYRWPERWSTPRFIRCALFSFYVVMGTSIALVSKKFLWLDQPFYHIRYISILYGTVSVGFVMAALHSPLTQKIYKARWLGHLGRIGYSFYLLHLGVLQAVVFLDWNPYLSFWIAYGLCTLLSTFTFLLIEQPSIRFSYVLMQRMRDAHARNG